MKKASSLILTLAFMSIFVMQLVSAQYSSFYIDIGYGTERVIDFVRDFGAPLFEIVLGESASSEFFLTKILMLFLLYLVIRAALTRTEILGDNPTIPNLVALLVSIIAIRYIANIDVIQTLLLPYGTMGIAILGLLPGIIFFYFIYTTNMGPLGRKIAWIIYGITFLALWWTRAIDIGDTGNMIYTGVVVAIIAMILFDKRIKAYFNTHDYETFISQSEQHQIADLQARYQQIANIDSPEASATRKRIRKKLYKLGSGLN